MSKPLNISESDGRCLTKTGTTTRMHVQSVIVRTTVDILRTFPTRIYLSQEPEVRVEGVVDLSPDPTTRSLPLHFRSSVKIYADGTVEVLSFASRKASSGAGVRELIDIYEHAFANALVSTQLNILGVRP